MADSLALERLRLEIEQLRVETGASRWSPWLNTGTLLAALAAAAISLFTALRAQRVQVESLQSQLEQGRQDRISRLLEQLGHPEAAVRAGVAQALGRFPEAAQFVATALEFEADPTVQAAIRSSLQEGPPEGLAALIGVTRRLGERQRRLVFKLRASGLKATAIAEFLQLPLQVVLEWLGTRPVPDTEIGADDIDPAWTEERDELSTTLTRIVQIASTVIAYRAERNGPCSVTGAHLPGADFTAALLGASCFDGCALWGSNFDFAEARGSSFSGAYLTGASLRRAALHDTNWTMSRIDGASFRRSRLARADFTDAEGKEPRFDGAKIAGAIFERCKFEEARFQGAMGNAPSFSEATLFRAHFTSAVLPGALMAGTDLRGARLGKAQLRRADFSRCQLGGNVIGGADLRESSFNGATIRAIRGSDSAKLEGVTADGAEFQSGAEQFRDVLLGGGPTPPRP